MSYNCNLHRGQTYGLIYLEPEDIICSVAERD
jgi:hypothetical protein